MPKKPIVATAEELEAAEARLIDLIKKAQAEAAGAVQVVDQKWQEAVKVVKAEVDSNAGIASSAIAAAAPVAKEYTEECISALNEQLLTLFPPIEEQMAINKEEAAKQVEEVDSRVQQLVVDELSALAAQFDEELQNLKKELTQNLEDMGREAAEALVQQRRELDESIEKLRVETAEDRARIREESKLEFERVVAAQVPVDKRQDQDLETLKKAIYAEFARVEEVIGMKEAKAHEHAEQVAAAAESNRLSLAEQNHERLVRLNGETAQLRDGLREVENVSTRRVEWVIKQAADAIRPPSDGWSVEESYRSFLSPKFNGAGAWGMQFELQLFGPPGRKEADEAASKPTGSGAGNLGLHLWACKGTRIACKLYIGDRAISLEKKFNGISPASSGRLAWLKDQINKEDDTLRVGVEFLEAMREVEYPNRIPPPPMSLTGKAPEEIDGVLKAISVLEGEGIECSPGTQDPEPNENSLDGSLCFMRHLSNRVMDQVRDQVSGMESRMIRKIQWLVQNASKMKQHFAWGQAMCSPCFSAAGVENMQFALYPTGYGNVTEGFCSLFLYCNAGVTMHCFLSMAKQARELTHTWDEPGAFGRTNFCLFDHVIDVVDDTILVTLEIEEAQQDVSTPWTHQEAAKGAVTDKDLSSIVKLTRNPGKAPNGKPNGRSGKMDTAMNLASIWTAKAFVDAGESKADGGAAIPENFHSFDEVVNRRPMPVRPDSAGKKIATPSSRMSRHGSAPTLSPSAQRHEQAARTAMQEDLPLNALTPPLPPVSAGTITLGSTTGTWETELPGGASSYGMARKAAARRPRPGSQGSSVATQPAVRFGGTM